MTRIVKAIVAMDERRVIGNSGALPWNLPEDMKRFSRLTKGHAVLMGRKTFDSLPEKFKPLPGRINIVVTGEPKKLSEYADVLTVASPKEGIDNFLAGKLSASSDQLWVIGGAQIYSQTVNDWTELELTLVQGEHTGDAFFPIFEQNFQLTSDEPSVGCRFLSYRRKLS